MGYFHKNKYFSENEVIKYEEMPVLCKTTISSLDYKKLLSLIYDSAKNMHIFMNIDLCRY